MACLGFLPSFVLTVMSLLPPTSYKQKFELTGRLLVASPSMDDPRFVESVILLVENSSEGSLGFIINKPMLEKDFAHIEWSYGPAFAKNLRNSRAHVGGPLGDQGFIIHSSEFSFNNTIVLNGFVGISGGIRALSKAFKKDEPDKFIFVFGYAGWGIGQLEREIKQNDWVVATADYDIVFDRHNSTKWLRALKRRLLEL